MRALLGLGSNLGDRRRHLRNAVAALGDRVVAISRVYETEPVGGPEQDPFLNLVVAVDVDIAPRELLSVCHRLEAAAGRVRQERWGPRTLDVDILHVDGVALDDDDLTIPHPRMWERAFVVEPLAEVAPDLVTPERRRAADGAVLAIGELVDDHLNEPGERTW